MKKNFQKGLTLIEMIVTIAIFIVTMGALFLFIYWGYKTYNFAFQQNKAIREARRGIETMVKEIREAREGEDGSYPIEKADDFEFIFYSDIDRDDRVERVRYFLEGTEFKKGVIDPTGWPISYPSENEKIEVLSRYVRNGATPIFTYYNKDWPEDTVNNPLTTPTSLQETTLMHVYLKINVNPEKVPQDFELESDVQIRNLRPQE